MTPQFRGADPPPTGRAQKVQRRYSISPAPMSTSQKTKRLVGWGRYLVLKEANEILTPERARTWRRR
jgi:hypothetical protein